MKRFRLNKGNKNLNEYESLLPNDTGNLDFNYSSINTEERPNNPIKFSDLAEDDFLYSGYESLDYDKFNNEIQNKEETQRGYKFYVRKQVMRWIVMLFVGILTGLIGVLIDILVENLSEAKYSFIATKMSEGIKNQTLWVALLCWIGTNCGLTLVAALLVIFLSPAARGSGIAQVKCYLNGVKIPHIVRFKTLVAKVFGVAFAVSGGLVCGKEGPMIHSGSIVAAGISQGLSTSLKFDLNILNYFRTDTEKRDFVSGGAAAGVAAAFGAPVGGVLFSLEEGASFWNQSLTWRIFFGSMVSTFTLNIFLSFIRGNFGDMSNPGLINFGKFDNVQYKWYELPIFIFMGLFGGLLGALFNKINISLTKFRNNYVKKWYLMILECLVVATTSAVIGFLLIFFIRYDCQPIGRDNVTKYPVELFCDDGQYNAISGLFFQTPEKSVRSLFHDPPGAFNPITLIAFCVLYFFLATWTYGLAIPSGLFIPSLLIGAAWGRLFGIGFSHLLPDSHIQPGKYALIGAASSLGGILRMTLSLTVIVTEATGDISLGVPIMFAIMASKWAGDIFNEGIFDMHVSLAGIPLLDWDPPLFTSNINANDVMSHPVVVLNERESVARIVDVLKTTKHHGFPVVESFDPKNPPDNHFGLLKGLILRHQLITLLKKKSYNGILKTEDFTESYPRYLDINDLQISEGEMSIIVDLRAYMNLSPYSVTEHANLPRIFRLFRGLGLRHLIITDDHNQVVGITTRIDIAKYRGHVGLTHSSIKELRVIN